MSLWPNELLSFWEVVGVAMLVMLPIAWISSRKSPPEE